MTKTTGGRAPNLLSVKKEEEEQNHHENDLFQVFPELNCIKSNVITICLKNDSTARKYLKILPKSKPKIPASHVSPKREMRWQGFTVQKANK